jgi:F-type H+-transporting ATPase subunit beta
MSVRTVLLGRIMTPDMQPLDGLDLLDPITGQPQNRAAPPPPRQVLETGIKVLDLFTPLCTGGLHRVMGEYGMGKDVLLAELIYRIAQHYSGCAVWVASAEQHPAGNHMVQEFRESNVLQHMSFVIGEPSKAAAALRTGQALAQALAEEGVPVLLGVEDELVKAGSEMYLPPLELATRLLITHGVANHNLPASLTMDATIVLSRALAEKRLFPAVDLTASRSALLDRAEVGEAHVRLAAAVRTVLLDQRQERRSELLQRFCAQPFFTAEPYTAQPGAYVPLSETLEGFATILQGTYDDVSEALLTYQGQLPVHP